MVEISLSELKDADKFSRFMDQLLNKKFKSTPIRPPHDKGRDSYFLQTNNLLRIFQYKYFLTAMNSTQKNNVKESLETAIKNFDGRIEEWILCLPREISSAEETFLTTLSNEKSIKISTLGEAEIKNIINETNFDVENYFESQIHKKNYQELETIKNLIENSDPKKEMKFEILRKVVSHVISLQNIKQDIPIEPAKDIKEKMKINNLSKTFEEIFTLQMRKFPQIENFLISGAISSDEIDRMLTSLKMVYLKFKIKSKNGDDIFLNMVNEVLPINSNDEEHRAYITLICYFFHTCEVFEKC